MPEPVRPMRDGLVVGLIGYGSVAALYATFDILAARGKFFTVNLLGKAVFRGERDPSILMLPIALDSRAIFLYNGMHLAISLAVGVIVTRLILQAERNPSQALAVMLTIVGGFFATVVAVGALTTSVRPLLPWWSIVAANLLAVAVASVYLLSRRPGLLRRLTPFLHPGGPNRN